MTTPVRITILGASLILDGVAYHFSTPAAATEAMCLLREPKHVPRGGTKFDRWDAAPFAEVKNAWEKLTNAG